MRYRPPTKYNPHNSYTLQPSPPPSPALLPPFPLQIHLGLGLVGLVLLPQLGAVALDDARQLRHVGDEALRRLLRAALLLTRLPPPPCTRPS